MNTKPSFLASAGPLLLLLFIDGMGLGLVLPILNAVIINTNGGFFGEDSSVALRNFTYGLTLGIFMLGWFFGAAILGDLSDRIGRKKALIICLIGAALSYSLSALAVTLQSVLLLIFGRTVAGLTAGSQAIAQAAIVDLSTDENKTRNIGLVLCAMSLGFIAGPLLGALFSNNEIVPWFSLATPFYFAAIISVINLVFLLWLFKEHQTTRKEKVKIRFYYAIELFLSAFQNKKVRNLSVIFFIFILGWSCYYSFVSMFLLKTHHFTNTEVSLFLALMGVGFGIGNGFLVDYFTKRFALNRIFVLSTVSAGFIILLMVLIPSALFNWILVIPLCASVAVGYAVLLSLFSNQVDAASQGWVMGITGSIMALVWAVESVVVGVLATWSHELPLFIAGFSMLMAVMIGVWRGAKAG